MRFEKYIKLLTLLGIPILIFGSVALSGQLNKLGLINKLKQLAAGHRAIVPIKKTQFSDEVLIKSAVYKFKQSVKNQNHRSFERLISKDFEDSTGLVRGKSAAKQKFSDLVKDHDISLRSRYSQRRTPKVRNIKPTWDFEMNITDINILDKMNNAIVKCDIYFAMDQPNDVPGIRYAKKPKRVKEKLFLMKENGKWKIRKVNKLFQFMSERNNRLVAWRNARKQKYITKY